jgi:hypothetical protein
MMKVLEKPSEGLSLDDWKDEDGAGEPIGKLAVPWARTASRLFPNLVTQIPLDVDDNTNRDIRGFVKNRIGKLALQKMLIQV